MSAEPRPLDSASVADFERCIDAGGVALFPADTVYGLGTDPGSAAGVERLYRIKGRPADRPAAVMFFRIDAALDALPDLGERTRDALERLLPGGLTVVLPNPSRRFALACGPAPERLGLRVPALTGRLEPLAVMRRPVLQSSANPSGARDAPRLEDVASGIRAAVDLELDAGPLPGKPSTVVDLTSFEAGGDFSIVREGAVDAATVEAVLATQGGRRALS